MPKIESLGGRIQNFLLERGNKKGVDKETGGLPLFYYFTVQSYLLCVEKVRFPLLLFRNSVFCVIHARFSGKILNQVFIVLKPGIICTFLIHSGCLQKMLTALFNLV